jgi:Calpain family cysteine protease
MKWLPNPYTIAQQLANVPDITSIIRSGGKTADAFLLDAFVSGRKRKTITGALKVFREIADLFDSPVSLSQALDRTKKIWAREGYSTEEIVRALPSLVPILEPVSRETFADADDLVVNNVSFKDPVQGDVGDCYLISAMIALAWTKSRLLGERLNASRFDPAGTRSFAWQFHDHTGPVNGEIEVTGRMMMNGNTPRYARSSSPVEDWPSLVEKAYVAKVGGANVLEGEPSRANYVSIDAKNKGSTPPAACQALVGGAVKGALLDSDAGRRIFSQQGRLAEDDALSFGSTSRVTTKPVMAWTKPEEEMEETDPDVWKATGIWPRHAYAVLGVMFSNNRITHVVIRNPHGTPTDPDRPGYHDGPWEPDDLAPVPLNQNGVFAISRELFYTNFEDIGWVVL